MVRVLHIFHNMGNGGIENFVMNYYRAIDREKIQFDFLTSVEEEGYFDEEIKKMGGHIYHAYPKKKNPIKNYFSIAKIVRDKGYSIVHRHTGSAISNIDLLAARHGGAEVLISHSHATQAGEKWLHYLARIIFHVKVEEFACSKEAGRWLFGKIDVENGKVQIIRNAIETQLYRFDEEERRKVREEKNASGKLIIGHVGNFNEVKNQTFIIDIFNSIQRKSENVELWLVGDGEWREKIEKKVEKLELQKKVVFWGKRNDVSNIMQGMDVFLFPSLHEGFGIVLIEAQCSGLYCLASIDTIPKEVNITETVKFISLNESAETWGEEIIKILKKDRDREWGYKRIKEAGFDIKDAAEDLERRYLTYARQK